MVTALADDGEGECPKAGARKARTGYGCLNGTMKHNKQRSKAVSVSQKSAVQTAEKSNETAQQQAPRAAGSVQKLRFHTPRLSSRRPVETREQASKWSNESRSARRGIGDVQVGEAVP